MPVPVNARDVGSGTGDVVAAGEITSTPLIDCTPPFPIFALPDRLKLPGRKVGFASGPENRRGPLNVVPPPNAPPELRNVIGPLSVLPSKLTVPSTVKDTPGMKDVGVGEASSVVVRGPVMTGLVKLKVSRLAACAGSALNTTDIAIAEIGRNDSIDISPTQR